MHHLITRAAPSRQHELLCHFEAQPVTLSEIPGHGAHGPLNGGIHSYGTRRQGTPRTMWSPNGRLPIQACRHLRARIGLKSCAEGGGAVRWRICSLHSPPKKIPFIKPDISIKMEPQKGQSSKLPLRICFTMCYTIWESQWNEKQGRPKCWQEWLCAHHQKRTISQVLYE